MQRAKNKNKIIESTIKETDGVKKCFSESEFYYIAN